MMPRYVRSTRLPVPRSEAFAWHERPGAFERLTPPFMPTEVESGAETIEEGAEAVLRLLPGAGPRSPRWRARHVLHDPPREFVDEQVSGPFAEWVHRHRFEEDGEDRSVLTDDVSYRLPAGTLGTVAAGEAVRRRLDRMFAYRHRVTVADLADHASARARGVTPMKIAVTGSSGLIGEALVAFLRTGGHDVHRVVRRPPRHGEIGWRPDEGHIDAAALRPMDAVVHLAGEPIASGRWSEEQKRRILESRTKGTRLLAEAMAGLDDGPRVLVSASGVNYYGSRGDERLTERSSPGDDFLADVCRQWEDATSPAADAGVRVVIVRTGIVQSPQEGALARQLPFFRAGLGGRFGSGRQWVCWVSLEDVVGIYHHALTTEALSGPVNATAPEPVTNAEYAKALGRVLGRPAIMPIPRLGPKMVFGKMVDPLLFSSLRVLPARTLESGYVFRHPTLEGALRHVLGRPTDTQLERTPTP